MCCVAQPQLVSITLWDCSIILDTKPLIKDCRRLIIMNWLTGKIHSTENYTCRKIGAILCCQLLCPKSLKYFSRHDWWCGKIVQSLIIIISWWSSHPPRQVWRKQNRAIEKTKAYIAWFTSTRPLKKTKCSWKILRDMLLMLFVCLSVGQFGRLNR